MPSTLSALVAAPLVVAGVVSHPALSPYDPLLALGLLAGAGFQGLIGVHGMCTLLLLSTYTILWMASACLLYIRTLI